VVPRLQTLDDEKGPWVKMCATKTSKTTDQTSMRKDCAGSLGDCPRKLGVRIFRVPSHPREESFGQVAEKSKKL